MHNSTTPLATRNLHSSPHSQPHPRTAKQGSISAAVQAQVEVEVGAVLVGPAQSVLRAQRVAARGAEVGDLDDDAVARVRELVARAVGLRRQFPAGAAAWARAGAGADAEGVLG